jgi:hypothetical protein
MFNLKPFSSPTDLVVDAFLRKRGIENAFSSFFPQTAFDNAFETWLRQRANNNVNLMRTVQGALGGQNTLLSQVVGNMDIVRQAGRALVGQNTPLNQTVGNVDVTRQAQGALSGAKGINVAGENAKRRKKLFGFGGFDFDLNDPDTLLGMLVGMLLWGR